MKIWILDCDVNNYENLMWREKLNLSEMQSFDGREKQRTWKPIKVKRMYNRKFSNTPGFSPHIPVFDQKAIMALCDFLKENAEVLPLNCEDGDFYAINVTNVLDCIDYEKAVYKTFKDGKRIIRFMKYSFDLSKVKSQHLFKIRDGLLMRPFVSDEFRNKVLECGLTGFKFELVWDSEKYD